jgi:hypothetical protein
MPVNYTGSVAPEAIDSVHTCGLGGADERTSRASGGFQMANSCTNRERLDTKRGSSVDHDPV